MSERRQARSDRGAAGAARYVGNDLPPKMAIGPCIEVWAGRDASTGSPPWSRARRNWAAAVDEWATLSGWAREGRPASNARNLARTRLVWSRAFLIARGETELVDYFEGHLDTYPGRRDGGWNPNHGTSTEHTTRRTP